MQPLLRRAAIAVATTAVLITAVPAGGAQAADPAGQAASWLASQTTNGLVHNDQYNFDDYGLTADVALALDTLGGQDAALADILDALKAHAVDYTQGYEGSGEVYAGSTAKLAALAYTTGNDAADFGGLDLVAQLEGRVSTTKPTAGRISDQSAYGDYANVLGQSFAVTALHAAGSSLEPKAITYLLKQQCDAGYFRLSFTKNKAAGDQTCDGGNPTKVSAPDTDATAFAVLALARLDSTNTRVQTALSEAKRWLKQNQKANGSFGGGTATEASNSNSTGLAALALVATGACAPAKDAAAWVAKRQLVSAPDGSGLLPDLGAVAYDAAATKQARSDDAITVEMRDQWRRASAQAAPALLFVAGCAD